MPYKEDPAHRILRLQRTVEAKVQSLKQLENEQSHLKYKHALLSSTCEVLAVFRVSRAAVGSHAGQQLSADRQGLIPADELLLLQQLANAQYSWSEYADVSIQQEDSPNTSSANRDPDFCNINRNNSSTQNNGSYLIPTPFNTTLTANTGPAVLAATASDAAHAASNPDSRTAPRSRPLGYLNELLTTKGSQYALSYLPPLPDPSVITLQQLQGFYHSCINQLTMQMSVLEQRSSSSQGWSGKASATARATDGALEVMEHIFARYFGLLNDLLLHNRNDVLVAFFLSDVVTGAIAEEQNHAVYLSAIQQLGLSQQQQDDIRACHEVYAPLIGTVMKALTDLQTEAQPPSAMQAADTAPAQAIVLPSSCSGLQKVQLRQAQQTMYEKQRKQEQHLKSLKITLGKQLVIAYLAMFAVLGNLSWVQIAKLALVCFPFPADPLILSEVIHSQYQQQHVHELQQQVADSAQSVQKQPQKRMLKCSPSRRRK